MAIRELNIAENLGTLRDTLSRTDLFHGLTSEQIEEVAKHGALVETSAGAYLARQGESSDAFYILIEGRASVRVTHLDNGSVVEVGQLLPGDTVGEMGVLLQASRSASVVSTTRRVLSLRFSAEQFDRMIERLPYFGLVLCRTMALRLQDVSLQAEIPEFSGSVSSIEREVLGLLPTEFRVRHRVIPLSLDDDLVEMGFVDPPTETTLALIQRYFSGLQIRSFMVKLSDYETVMRSSATGVVALAKPGQIRLTELLNRVVGEGASDLHLSSGQVVRWRIDGRLLPLVELGRPSSEQIEALVDEIAPPNRRAQFNETSDTDFAYALGDEARFRVNVFRDLHGVGAVFRHIPNQIRSLAQLKLPDVVEQFCALPNGLILVTGPTGSGKSTTLAAMVNHINSSRDEHIITLEDPIEFVHQSQKAMVNQREIGSHTMSFSTALRSALREDPDIVLVGEMRDLETVALALETAQTGHLVLATLHTSTAIGSIERILGLFPPEQQQQARQTLAEVFRGCISQTLLPMKTGGRVGAFEILVGDYAVANLIREMKTAQLVSHMETSRRMGNQLLNIELVNLVASGRVEEAAARRKAIDKSDFANRLKRQ